MKDFSSDLGEVRRRVGEAARYLNIETSRGLLVELESEVAKPDLWNDQEHAKKINSQYAALKADIDQFNLLSRTVDDLFVLHELARAEDDATQEPELENGIAQHVHGRTRRMRCDSADQRQRRWCRCPRLERNVAANVSPLGRTARIRIRNR